MATFIFDGTTNVTAAKADTVVISANPALFTNVSETGGNTVFNFGGRLLTITGTTYGDNTTQYPNVSLANGTFSTGVATVTATTPNALLIGGTTTTSITGGVAGGVRAIFGGLGTADPTDGNDTITIGGKGSLLVYGNAGTDAITQDGATTSAFDSSSFVTIFAGKNTVAGGNDTITLANATNSGFKAALYGGEGSDTINVVNTGASANTTIFGGQGAADPTDLADTINFDGGGALNVFGNAGGDTISLGTNDTGVGSTLGAGLNATTVAVVHGGRDADTINIKVAANAKATISVFGDENIGTDRDIINVTGNAGTTVIYGGTAAADAADGNDSISYTGQGTATIYAAGGDDSIVLNHGGIVGATGSVTSDSTSTTTVFGGNGNDSVNIFNASNAAGTDSITLGAGADSVQVGLTQTTLTANNNALAPTFTNKTDGTPAGGGAGTTETVDVTFKALLAGQSETVGGLTFTANTSVSAADVASNFSSLAAGATTKAGVTNGTYTGTLTTDFKSNAATLNSAVVQFEGASVGNKTDLAGSGSVGFAGAVGSGTSVTIADFLTGAGNDVLSIQNGIAGGGTFNIVDGSGAGTQQAALDLAVRAASNAQGTVSGVVFQGNAFVVVNNDGNATFNATTDLAIKLTGVTDLAALSSAVTIV